MIGNITEFKEGGNLMLRFGSESVSLPEIYCPKVKIVLVQGLREGESEGEKN